jgi:NADH-quinone oxidoreductase subunit C
MAQRLLELMRSRFGSDITDSHCQHGDETVVVRRESWLSVARWLRDDPAADMVMLVDLTAVDYPDRSARFEVVAHLLSLRLGHRLRMKTLVAETPEQPPEVDSVTELWASANWAERECYDMFGIRFAGHPDLRRILLYPEFEGYPLRKDYPADLAQPLVAYRTVENIDRLPPFGPGEGMPFGRRTDDARLREDAERNRG